MHCHFLLQGIFLTQGCEAVCPVSPTLQVDSLLPEPLGKPFELNVSPQIYVLKSYSPVWWYVTELVGWIHAGVLAWGKTPCHGQGVSFSDQIWATNNETDADTRTGQVLFNGQRMEKQEPSFLFFLVCLFILIGKLTQFRWIYQIYDSQGNREGIGKSGRNTHDLSETWV